MADILLDNRLTVNITAIKGDSLAPVSFVFRDSVTNLLEDFTGVTIICTIYNAGSDTPLRDLGADELSVIPLEAKVTIQLSAVTTAQLSKIAFKIKKNIGQQSTTRVKGNITFNI